MGTPELTDFELMDASTIKQYFGVLRQWFWLILVGILVGAGGTYFASRLQQPVYQASARVLVVKPANQNQNTDLSSSLNIQQFTQTYIVFFNLRTVLDAVEKELNIHLSDSQITASILQNTQFIDVFVEDNDPRQAALIADTLIKVVNEQSDILQGGRFTNAEQSLDKQIIQMEEQIASTQLNITKNPQDALLTKSLAVYQQIYTDLVKSRENIRLSILENLPTLVQVGAATWTSNPIRPRTASNTLIGGVTGLLIALSVIILIEFLDDTIKNKEDVVRTLGLNVLGYITEIDHKKTGVFVTNEPRSPVSEAFRTLRTNLEYIAIEKPIQSLLVTSSGVSEGKTTISANLAAILAQGGKKVLLIDVDFGRPNLHRYFGVSNRHGLSDLFRGQCEFEEAIQTLQGANNTEISLITTGALPPNPTELLGSERMRAILEKARTFADFVLLDSPPAMLADTHVLAPRVDGVLVVILTGRTHREVARTILESLRSGNPRLVGAVLNRIKPRHAHYGYNGSSAYSYQYTDSEISRQQPAEIAGENKRSLLSFFKNRKK